ncbi:Uncharacterised protein [Staphylococcus aureus]|nr:Uncharacterised protein [Staphylococcus aureus]CUG79372.1 Uncharacterised protein [Staphylococcus aureus]SAY53427.1 Uncharacterised protein [Staphylococcus aureus]SCT61311.1 Uncharacterised protein [Staphylococcus aureus]
MLSTTEIKPCSFAISADFLMSVTRNNGLEGVSINNIFVVGRIACTIESVCVVSTKSTSMPNRVNTFVNAR